MTSPPQWSMQSAYRPTEDFNFQSYLVVITNQ